MNRLLLLLYSMLFCGLFACNGAGKSFDTLTVIEKTDSCTRETTNTYEVYVSARKVATEKLALLLIIDAHGGGKFALSKFKQGANQFPVVLVASNLIKNGYEGYEKAIQTLIDDVRKKYPVNETVYIAGFSGGARMAMGYALSHQANGLIMCGALANADQLTRLSCPVISVSGTDDFNFMETAQYLFNEQQIPANLKIELTNDSHGWPDSSVLSNSLGFLLLSSQSTSPLPDSILKYYCSQQLTRIDSLKQHGDYLKAALVARNMASIGIFNGDNRFGSVYNMLIANRNYIGQLTRLEKCLQFEIGARQPYVEAFQTKDTVWWKNEIANTLKKINTEQDPFTKDTYKRIKGFWGIACYSLCKQAIMQQNVAVLQKVLVIYRTLEPQNADMFYFSAFPYLWQGNNEMTVSLLKNALKAGFADKNQLKTDFPEFIYSAVL